MFVTFGQLVSDLSRLGLEKEDVVMVHSSMQAVGKILGGPDVVIQALLAVAGTVMIYVDWEDGVQPFTRSDALAEPEILAWLEEAPAFDPRRSRAARAYGILPEFLRTWPEACRSGNPDASVAAIGAKAAWLCADHPLQYGYGPGSPLAKLVQAQGKVLLLGAPLDSLTLLHHAEHMAKIPHKRIIRYREPMLVDGLKTWVEIEEFDTDLPVVPAAWDGYFGDIAQSYLDTGQGRTGPVGNARSYLFEAAGLHHYAVAWLEARFGNG